jgi:CRP-like cAMP-binding protein
MQAESLIARLAAHTVIGAAPAPELTWVAAHSRLRTLARGEILSRPSEPVTGLYIVLSGTIAVFVERPRGREKVTEWHGGEVSGVLPYSRLVSPPGDVVALCPTELLELPREELPQLIQHCPSVTTSLVHVMLDRARHFTTTDLQAEKMMSLGRLSAGLAHELNNPASAIARSARNLRDAMARGEDAARSLGALGLTSDQIAMLDDLRTHCLASAVRVVRAPLEQADREAAFADWLDAHGADPADAEALADTAAELPVLERLARSVPAAALAPVVRWLAAACLARHLTEEIEQGWNRAYPACSLPVTCGPAP